MSESQAAGAGQTFRIEVAAVDPAGITGQVTVWD